MEKQDWSFVITARAGWLDFRLKELWEYRNLVWMFVKRNFATMYKQTILGPLWIVINPLLSTFVLTIVFGRIANIPTAGVPDYLFYMSGNILWAFFSASLSKVSATLTGNAALFGKVYFPRLAVPLSNVLTNMFSFLIQFCIYLGFLFYMIAQHADIHPNAYALLFPLLLLELGLLAIGFGTMISALTAKYHDLAVLVSFGLQLWMYASPVVYPASVVPAKYEMLYMLNPVAPVLETFRYGFLGCGSISFAWLGVSFLVTGVVLFLGLLLFHRVERVFLDTV